jgi:site-specific recombinase XerD
MVRKQITLSQAIEGYTLAAHARRLSPHTLADYDNTFRKLETYLGRDPPLATITTDQIRQFLGSLNGLSAKTLANHRVGLSALWTWALKEGIVERHIVREIPAPRPERRDIAPYTQRDLEGMLTACERTRTYARPGVRPCDNSRPTADRDKAIIYLLTDTGIRASELCGLRLRHVDLQNQRIQVMGKGRKERVVPISPATGRMIWRYLTTRDNTAETAFLFTSLNEQPLSRHALRRLLKGAGERAGVLGANVHRFRHTFAIQFLRNGGSIFALQRILGHSTLDMVRRYLAIAQADIETAHRNASPVANWLR